MTPSDPDGVHLAFDYGSKRIGVATGTGLLGVARPLTVVSNHHGTPDWQSIDRLVADWLPIALVIGIPLLADGEDQPITGQARGFGKRLARRTGLPVHEADERFSSTQAQRELAGMRASGQRQRRISRADVDASAAALILEHWFGRPR